MQVYSSNNRINSIYSSIYSSMYTVYSSIYSSMYTVYIAVCIQYNVHQYRILSAITILAITILTVY